MYEVEMKFRIGDPGELERFLASQGIAPGREVEEVDLFYQHPSRDFVETDEGLRIRRRIFTDGIEQRFLTYKGPKIDPETKTRKEIEIPIEDHVPWNDLLTALGFQPKGNVRKFRRRAELSFRGRAFELLLDRLPELDDTAFLELETIAAEEDLAEARNDMLELASTLNLTESIRTSYLGLLSRADPD